MNETQLTMAKQIGAKELNFAKFKLFTDGENTVGMMKGQRFLKITYVRGRDTYTVEKSITKNYETIKEETLQDVYHDQLRELIEGHFPTFNYVMDSSFGGAF